MLSERSLGLRHCPFWVFFSSKAFERQETELIVVVTARLVDPIEAGDMPPLPGEDMLSDPNDVQLFLLNVDETKDRKPRSRRIPRRPSGSVGFERWVKVNGRA